jgi:hypothetical protein
MRIFLFVLFFSVLPKLHGQTFGVSFFADYNPMDISGFNAVISEQLQEPVITNAAAFLKLGVGFEANHKKFCMFFSFNSFSPSRQQIADTTYKFGYFRFEWNLGYHILERRNIGLESYIGWVINDASYDKSFNETYSSLNQYWSAPYRFKRIVYNSHFLQIGVRLRSQKISLSNDLELGFSLRSGVLFPLGTGKIAMESGGGQKIKVEDLLIEQPFYVGLLITLSTKEW